MSLEFLMNDNGLMASRMRYSIDDDMAAFYGDDVRHPGDAFDLRTTGGLILKSGQREVVDTGVRVSLAETFVGFVLPRSGLAANFGITVVNSPGLIDSGYRGEIRVILYNSGFEEFVADRGDRIAQFLITKAGVGMTRVHSDEIDTDTERGVAGFGSTGTK